MLQQNLKQLLINRLWYMNFNVREHQCQSGILVQKPKPLKICPSGRHERFLNSSPVSQSTRQQEVTHQHYNYHRAVKYIGQRWAVSASEFIHKYLQRSVTFSSCFRKIVHYFGCSKFWHPVHNIYLLELQPTLLFIMGFTFNWLNISLKSDKNMPCSFSFLYFARKYKMRIK